MDKFEEKNRPLVIWKRKNSVNFIAVKFVGLILPNSGWMNVDDGECWSGHSSLNLNMLYPFFWILFIVIWTANACPSVIINV